MSTENLDGIYSYPAAADLRTSQYCFAVLNGSGQAALIGANAIPDGQIHNLPNTGEMCRLVQKEGVVLKAKYGGTVAVNALLTTDASGRLVTATSGQNVVAKALVAGVVNDIGQVLYYRYRGVAP
jgi:hypothetical protein